MQRYKEIDILKAICILLIVIYHANINIYFYKYIFLYGFLFSSGYTYKEKPKLVFLKTNIFKLYQSFIVFGLMGLILIYFLSKLINDYPLFIVNFDDVCNIFLLNATNVMLAPAWFILPLIGILLLFRCIHSFLSDKQILLFSFITYVTAIIYSNELSKYQWNNCAWLFNIMVGFFVFTLGYFYKNYIYSKTSVLSKNKLFIHSIYLTTTFFLARLYNMFNFSLDLRIGLINSLALNTIYIILGILNLISLSKIIEKMYFLEEIFSFIGKRTMCIMFFHLLGFCIITIFLNLFLLLPYPWESWNFAYDDSLFIKVINTLSGVICSLMMNYLINTMKKLILFVKKI